MHVPGKKIDRGYGDNVMGKTLYKLRDTFSLGATLQAGSAHMPRNTSWTVYSKFTDVQNTR